MDDLTIMLLTLSGIDLGGDLGYIPNIALEGVLLSMMEPLDDVKENPAL